MENIILKSRKDLGRTRNRPTINDILSLRGFLRYFFYRNTLPAFRDFVYFIFDTVQILLILNFLGFKASTGGILGHMGLLFIASAWNLIVYSMREKILELNSAGRLNLVPNYFSPLLASGGFIWVLIVIATTYMVKIHSPAGNVIFVGKLLSGGLDLFSTLYFFSTYTLSRVYIPLGYTVLNRLFNLLFPLLLVRHIGPWAFVLSFFLEKGLNALITVKYCNRTLRVRGVELIPRNMMDLVFKNSFWFLRQKPVLAVKRSISFSLINLQKLIIIVLVNRYYNFYVVDFFLFYQLITVFLLFPYRISKSLYYDLTSLLYRNRFHTLRTLLNYNLIITMLLGLGAAYVFYLIPSIPVPKRFYNLIFEFIIMDKWRDLYMLVFFTFGISVLGRMLLVSEAHILFSSMVLLFDYLLLAWLVAASPFFFQLGDPLFIFSFQGQLSPYYFLALLLLYLSGVWKKESLIARIRSGSDKAAGRKEFLRACRSSVKEPVVVMMVLMQRYTGRHQLESIIEQARERMGLKSFTRVSRNTLMLLLEGAEKAPDRFELEAITSLGVYCEKILVSEPKDLRERVSRDFYNSSLGTDSFLANMVFPTLRSTKDDIIPGDAAPAELLMSRGIEYREHSAGGVVVSNRKKHIFELFSITSRTSGMIPERQILKKNYLGLLPIIRDGKAYSIIELEGADLDTVKSLLRTLLVRDLWFFISEVGKGKG